LEDLMRYTGDTYWLAADQYVAAISESGARLRSLEHDGRPLVAPFSDSELPPVYRGAVLAPWPNRIGDGLYTFGGQVHQLPINEPDRMTALHGLVAWEGWTLSAVSSAEVTQHCRIWPQSGYPFMLEITIVYGLDATGLTISLTARNDGDRSAPYGCSIHPYLVAGPGLVDDWSLQLPADRYVDVDELRLLPTALRSVTGTTMDFRSPQILAQRRIDHALTGLAFESNECSAQLRHSDGLGVQMTWDDACRWVQIHTADRPEPHLNRSGLATEPMTCPPNAFQSGEGLIELEPGDAVTTRWRISAIGLR
jgi:aldose 1-epimerase